MNPIPPNESFSGNYFALPRLLARWRGRGGARSESNWLEAYLPGIAIYCISYFFAARIFFTHLRFWPALACLVPLLFALWIFWLLIFYLNSLIVKFCKRIGLGADLSAARMQSVLIGILTSVFAALLLGESSWLRWIGLLWMIALALNLAAAFFLALFYDESR